MTQTTMIIAAAIGAIVFFSCRGRRSQPSCSITGNFNKVEVPKPKTLVDLGVAALASVLAGIVMLFIVPIVAGDDDGSDSKPEVEQHQGVHPGIPQARALPVQPSRKRRRISPAIKRFFKTRKLAPQNYAAGTACPVDRNDKAVHPPSIQSLPSFTPSPDLEGVPSNSENTLAPRDSACNMIIAPPASNRTLRNEKGKQGIWRRICHLFRSHPDPKLETSSARYFGAHEK